MDSAGTSENNFFIKLSDGGLSQQVHPPQFSGCVSNELASEFSKLLGNLDDRANVSEILSLLRLVYCSPNINSVDIRTFISHLLLGPLRSGQYKFLYDKSGENQGEGPENVIGFFSYAFLGEEEARAFANSSSEAGIWSQKPEDGELYIIDFIAPFGRVMSCCREVHREIFRKFVKHPKYKAKSVVPFKAFRRPSDRRSKWKATPLSCRLQKT